MGAGLAVVCAILMSFLTQVVARAEHGHVHERASCVGHGRCGGHEHGKRGEEKEGGDGGAGGAGGECSLCVTLHVAKFSGAMGMGAAWAPEGRVWVSRVERLAGVRVVERRVARAMSRGPPDAVN